MTEEEFEDVRNFCCHTLTSSLGNMARECVKELESTNYSDYMNDKLERYMRGDFDA